MGLLDSVAAGLLLVTAFEASKLLNRHGELLRDLSVTRLRALANPEALAEEVCRPKDIASGCAWTMAARAQNEEATDQRETNDDKTATHMSVCENLSEIHWHVARYYLIGIQCNAAFFVMPVSFRASLFEIKSP